MPKAIRPVTTEHPLRMREADYREESEEGGGRCLNCRAVADQYCEPDAREYRCDVCGQNTVMGLEEMLVQELLEIR